MIKSVAYAAEQPGQKLLVLGAVHGNEKCGTHAINRVISEIDSGALKILKGRVTFVPICNPLAYERDVRFIERNLNRYLIPHEHPTTYEARLGNILCPILADADVLLDLHSYTIGGDAFTFISGPEDKREHEYAAILGPATLLYGFSEAYAATGLSSQDDAHKDEGIGTTEYMRRFGGISVTLECGQHKDPAGIEIAYRAIYNAMKHLGIIAGEVKPQPTRLVKTARVFYREDKGQFVKSWKHLEPLKRGELIAVQANGKEIHSPGDGFMILPHADTDVGTEWFYFGVED